jgi:hypothetical protein
VRQGPDFRVAVAGHRPDAVAPATPDVRAIRDAAASIVAIIQEVVGPGQVQMFSSLAPGPDRWVAAEAVAAGAELHVILPLPRDVCARDDIASPGDVAAAEAEFLALAGLAQSIVEPPHGVTPGGDASEADATSAFVAAGRATVERADLLIAVWDGRPARGPGGTGQAVEQALAAGVPIVWVPWSEPAAWRVIEADMVRPDTRAGD